MSWKRPHECATRSLSSSQDFRAIQPLGGRGGLQIKLSLICVCVYVGDGCVCTCFKEFHWGFCVCVCVLKKRFEKHRLYTDGVKA